MHTVGHFINFYHVSTQPAEHLRCMTKEMQFDSDFRSQFSFWIFQTITGQTGLLLYIVLSVIYVFAHPSIRQKAYSYFWSTHKLYYLFYILCLLHGQAKLTGVSRTERASILSYFHTSLSTN